MITVIVGIDFESETESETYDLEIPLDSYLRHATDPDLVDKYTDDEISEALVLFNETAQKLLMEAQRRGILQEIMNKAMELQGAPKKG